MYLSFIYSCVLYTEFYVAVNLVPKKPKFYDDWLMMNINLQLWRTRTKAYRKKKIIGGGVNFYVMKELLFGYQLTNILNEWFPFNFLFIKMC